MFDRKRILKNFRSLNGQMTNQPSYWDYKDYEFHKSLYFRHKDFLKQIKKYK